MDISQLRNKVGDRKWIRERTYLEEHKRSMEEELIRQGYPELMDDIHEVEGKLCITVNDVNILMHSAGKWSSYNAMYSGPLQELLERLLL